MIEDTVDTRNSISNQTDNDSFSPDPGHTQEDSSVIPDLSNIDNESASKPSAPPDTYMGLTRRNKSSSDDFSYSSDYSPEDNAKTLNQVVREITDSYLDELDMDDIPMPSEIESILVNEMRDVCLRVNKSKPAKARLPIPQKLFPSQIASIMLKIYPIVRIKSCGDTADPSYDLLALYHEGGPDRGIYTTNDDDLKQIAKEYCYTISTREEKEVLEFIMMDAPRVSRSTDRDIIAVNNGLFNFETKILEPFDPSYVFLAKSKVDYNPSATNVVIHNDSDGTDWDVESWMHELSDDPEIVQLLWEILSAIIRPHVRWNKSAWFYSNTGNNGKGTLCELMRSLCGDGSYAVIPLSDFGKDFALEPLTRANAIIVDENDVGTYIDKAANLKAIITNDVISINRKFKTPISYQFYGFTVQCLNEFPRIKDKSDSFYRRQLFIPFEKCFKGKERKYIKNDYLHRPEVLEYVLYRVLHINVYSLSEPDSCINLLNDFKENNDPVRQFMDEFSTQFVWDLLPFSFLYDFYKLWFKKNNPGGSIQGRNTFITDLLNIIDDYPEWYCEDKQKSIRPAHRMDAKEYLIWDYNILDWQNPYYSGTDKDKICNPILKVSYYGLLRKNPNSNDEQTE